jgi:hypothetical protein
MESKEKAKFYEYDLCSFAIHVIHLHNASSFFFFFFFFFWLQNQTKSIAKRKRTTKQEGPPKPGASRGQMILIAVGPLSHNRHVAL